MKKLNILFISILIFGVFNIYAQETIDNIEKHKDLAFLKGYIDTSNNNYPSISIVENNHSFIIKYGYSDSRNIKYTKTDNKKDEEVVNNSKLIDTKIFKDIAVNKYEKDKDSYISSISKNNKIINLYPIIYDIKANDNNIMILNSNTALVFIDFIYPQTNNKDIIVEYKLPIFIPQTSNIFKIKSAKIITPNIVRVEYDYGRIELWKVISSNKDYEKNKPLLNSKKDYSDITRKRLIWSNNIVFGKTDYYSIIKSWDYIDSPNEPILKELQERF